MSTNLQLVLCTVPNRECAEQIAEALVAEQLAACVNIIPGIASVYRWKGGMEKDEELLLLIKTSQSTYESLEQRIRALHPYELPEIIAVSLQAGQKDYIKWIENSLTTPS
jgi:periplasmic divalent cation tolerance protein